MRLTDILLALTLVVTSSMAVVPPGKNVQTPQSSQSPECQPGSSSGCQPGSSSECQPGPSNECQSKTSSSNNVYGLNDQVQEKYEDLQKRLRDAEKIKKTRCDKHREYESDLLSYQAIGRPGLGSFFGRFMPSFIKNRFGKVPDGMASTELDLYLQCTEAERIYKRISELLEEFKETHGIESEANTTGFFQWFKN
ncbi:hypothetical protein MT418_007602 [Batrachochytrium dendrobatidis]